MALVICVALWYIAVAISGESMDNPQVTIYGPSGYPVEQRAREVSRDRLFSMLFDHYKAASGESVTPKSALRTVAYFACIRGISEDIAKMPWRVYAPGDSGGKMQVPGHPVSALLKRWNVEMGGFVSRSTWIAHALAFHGGFCEIVRANNGRAVGIWPLDPTRTELWRNADDGVLYCLYRQDSGKRVVLDMADVLHIHGLGLDGLTALCMHDIGREAIGNLKAVDKYQGAFFGNSATPSGILEAPVALSEEARKNLREGWAARHEGGANAWRTALLEEGITWKQISFNAKDSQLTEAAYASGVDICRLFRYPQTKAGFLKEAHYNNLEHENRAYVQDCLLSWNAQIEDECDAKLLTAAERDQGYYIKIDVRGLLEGDSITQAEYHNKMFMVGGVTVNEIRALNDYPPVDGGDQAFVPANMIPLSTASSPPVVAEPEQQAPQNTTPSVTRDMRAAWVPAIAHVADRQTKIFHDRVARARRKDDFEQWLINFRAQHEAEARAEYAPVVHAYVCSTANDVSADEMVLVGVCADAITAQHMAALRADIDPDPLDLMDALLRAFDAQRGNTDE